MSGYVYAIAAGDLVKLGWSARPWQRLSKVRADSGVECAMLGYVAATVEQEAELHRLLAPQRERGEWFRREGPVEHFLELIPKPAQPRKRRPRVAAPTIAATGGRTPAGADAAKLLSEIDAFLAAGTMAATTFGREAANDGKFVGRLRAGHDVTSRMADRVRAFIAAQQVAA